MFGRKPKRQLKTWEVVVGWSIILIFLGFVAYVKINSSGSSRKDNSVPRDAELDKLRGLTLRFRTFSHYRKTFPGGNCEKGSIMLVLYLRDVGYRGFKLVEGTKETKYGPVAHSWIARGAVWVDCYPDYDIDSVPPYHEPMVCRGELPKEYAEKSRVDVEKSGFFRDAESRYKKLEPVLRPPVPTASQVR